VAASRCIGQSEDLGATIRRSQASGANKFAHYQVELKQSGIGLMDRVRANWHLQALLKGLPLNTNGLKKHQHESIAKTPCTLLFSFDGYMQSIETPAQALGSLLQHSELDSEAKDIVRAMMRLRSEYVDARTAKRGSRKKEG